MKSWTFTFSIQLVLKRRDREVGGGRGSGECPTVNNIFVIQAISIELLRKGIESIRTGGLTWSYFIAIGWGERERGACKRIPEVMF